MVKGFQIFRIYSKFELVTFSISDFDEIIIWTKETWEIIQLIVISSQTQLSLLLL